MDITTASPESLRLYAKAALADQNKRADWAKAQRKAEFERAAAERRAAEKAAH